MNTESSPPHAEPAEGPGPTPGPAPTRRPLVPVVIGLGVLAVLLLGQVLFRRSGAQTNRVALTSTPKGVTVVEVQPARYRPTRRYVGTLEPWIEARVGPQLVAAYVSAVLVRPGAVVRVGDVLATLDCRAAHATTQAVSLQAQAVEAHQVALASQASRMTGLLDGGFVAPNEVEQRQAESASEQARLLATRAQLLGSTLAVRDCVLRAPFDGEVGDRLADPGAFVRPGGAIVTLVDRRVVRVNADVPETDYDAVAPGTPVRMRLLATGRELGGTIARRSPSADPSTRTIHVEIDLPNADRRLPVNTTAEITVDVGEPAPAQQLPLIAANVGNNRASVFVVDGDVAHAQRLQVLGERGGDLFVAPTLAPGAWVVTEGRAPRAAAPAGQEAPAVTALALRNPIAVLMICIALVVFAAVVTPRMAVDTFPELTPPVLVIGTQVPGLGARDMEKTITWRIEKYVSATPGVDHVESTSRNGFSICYVWLAWGTDLNAAQTLVQQQVAFAMAAVPKSLGVIPPFVLQYDPSNAPVVQVVVTGGGLTGAQLFDFAQNNVEPILEGIPGVASASPNGGRQRQINVIIDPVRAQARGVTSTELAAVVARSNALLPSGELIRPHFDANVYTNAVAARVATIGDAVVKIHDGHPVLLRDVARIEDGGAPETQAVAVNGQDAIYLNVLRVPGGNTIAIVDAVKHAIATVRDLPPGMIVRPVFDQSTFVRTSYHGLQKEVLQALVLIALVILLFLQSGRGTLIVSVAIPLSFAVTLIVLASTGQTLNAFTLGGLTLAMGRLVDDAVVVLESIHRHQRMGKSAARAALDGADAVALPVLASTLTTMAVLLPIVLLAGLAKKLFAPLALTVAVAMIASYFVSMVVTPVACRYFLGHAAHGRVGRAVEAVIDGVAARYARTLRVVLPYRATIMLASVALVAVSGYWSTQLPSTFFPEIDESMERVYVRFAPGTSLADAARQTNAMGRMLRERLPREDVEMVLTNVGTPGNARSAMTSPNAGPHMGFIRLALSDPEHRRAAQREIADRMRALLTTNFPGVEFLQWPGGLVASVFSNGYIAPLVVEVRGENLALLDAQTRAIAEVARAVPGIRDIYPSLQINYPEIRIDLDRQAAGLVGVDARQAAQSTLEATLGNINTPSVWIDPGNGQSYYVVTAYDPRMVSEPSALGEVPLRVAENGTAVTLGTYGNIRRSLGPVAVERNQLQRAAHVLMQTERRDIGSAAADLERRLREDPRTRDIHWNFVGQVALMRTTFAGLGGAIGLAVMVVFMIMASQFKSLRLPFVMLFTIPVSLLGIVLALMAAGQGFSITALMGVLMVIGIAVSNGILLVDDANTRMLDGADKLEAILAAARSRFVPIAMTSLATVIGLVPTALGLEAGTESNRPLALAVVGGLTSSTILSLFLVPVMFMLLAKRPVPEAAEATHGLASPAE